MGHDSMINKSQTMELLYDRASIDRAITRIADQIAQNYRGTIPIFITVLQGALPFAGQLLLALGERGQDVLVDYLHASRYHGSMTGSQILWRYYPTHDLAGQRVLLVEDILDEGYTLSEIRRWCLMQGAIDLQIAVLSVKQHSRRYGDIQADYIGVEVPDRYVVGYGMDANEKMRGLPGIYALKE